MKICIIFGALCSFIGLSACAGNSMPYIKSDGAVTIDSTDCGGGWSYKTVRTISDPASVSEVARFFNDRNGGFRSSFIDAPSGRYIVVFDRGSPSSVIVGVSPAELVREQRIRSLSSEEYDAFLKIAGLEGVPSC